MISPIRGMTRVLPTGPNDRLPVYIISRNHPELTEFWEKNFPDLARWLRSNSSPYYLYISRDSYEFFVKGWR
jgi:hypothetical protein